MLCKQLYAVFNLASGHCRNILEMFIKNFALDTYVVLNFNRIKFLKINDEKQEIKYLQCNAVSKWNVKLNKIETNTATCFFWVNE